MTGPGVTLSDLKAVISNLEQVNAHIEELQKGSLEYPALRLRLRGHQELLAAQLVTIAMRYHSNLKLECQLTNHQAQSEKSGWKNRVARAFFKFQS